MHSPSRRPAVQGLIGGALAVLVTTIVAAAAFLWWAFTSPPYQPQTPAEQAAYNLEVYDAVWERLERHHYDPAFGGVDVQGLRREHRPLAETAGSTAELYAAVLNPLLDRLGPSHLHAEPPANVEWAGVKFRMPMQRRGRDPLPLGPGQSGHGLVLAWVGDASVVQTVRRGSAAERAGIQPGQRLELQTFQSADPDRGHLLNRGVFLTERQAGEERQIVLEWPDVAPPPERLARLLNDGVMLIRFDEFTSADIDWALARLGETGQAGAILDLRGNVGGRVSEMVRLLSAVLPPGVEIGRLTEDGRTTILRTRPASVRHEEPFAVLIGPRSNSAAEATAAALQHHRRAAVVGAPSGGNLLVAVSRRLPYDGRLWLPVADYRGPGGAMIEGVGVTPDIEAAETLAAIRQDRDLVVEAAQAWIATQR